ncbi:hypothetical protein LEMLEM_LOCUS18827 [Lemmus lemmus]
MYSQKKGKEKEEEEKEEEEKEMEEKEEEKEKEEKEEEKVEKEEKEEKEEEKEEKEEKEEEKKEEEKEEEEKDKEEEKEEEKEERKGRQKKVTPAFSLDSMAVFPIILIANRFCQHTGILDDYEDACTDWKMLTPALWHFFFVQDIGMKIQHYKMVLLGLAHGLLSKSPNQKCCVETSLVGPDLLSVLGFNTEPMGQPQSYSTLGIKKFQNPTWRKKAVFQI